MKSSKGISHNVIDRLPRYLRFLTDLQEHGEERISSKEIAEAMNTTASQVRQDFTIFGSYGVQGYGYQIDYLIHSIKRILGLNKKHQVIVVGVGGIGRALLEHMDFESYHYQVCAAFDVDPDVVGKQINGVTVHHMDDVEKVVGDRKIDICMLTVSKSAAAKVAERMRRMKVSGILNFTNVELQFGDKDIFVRNVSLLDSLFTLTYYLEENNL